MIHGVIIVRQEETLATCHEHTLTVAIHFQRTLLKL